MNKRVDAFSLAELLVVMVISGLVAGAVYFSYYTVSASHKDLSTSLNRFNAIHELSYMMKRDIDRSSRINSLNHNQVNLLCGKYGEVCYRFYPDKITRNQNGMVDEFLGSFELPEFYFNAAPVIGETQLIDVIKIKTQSAQLIDEFVFYKKYDRSSLIQFATPAIHNESF